MTEWLILTASLPTSPSALRVRIWRALKAAGTASLREGVYILPAHAQSAAELWAIERSIHDAGADAHMLQVKPRDAAQEQVFRALFDRSEQFTEFAQSLKQARKSVQSLNEAAQRKLVRTLGQHLLVLQEIDYFPSGASASAADAYATFRAEVERAFSPGEPGVHDHGIEQLAVADFQGRTWATRQRPWVDRLASAWLIQRFIDSRPRFIWLADPDKCPKSALGYDFDGARFTHVGGKVSFEVLACSFGLDVDPALRRLGQLVHCIDAGGIPVDEAAGLETVVRGLQALHSGDTRLLEAASGVFDAFHAGFGASA